MGVSVGQLLVVLLIILVLFGAGKLPQVMSDLGNLTNIIIGFGFIGVGFALATRWR